VVVVVTADQHQKMPLKLVALVAALAVACLYGALLALVEHKAVVVVVVLPKAVDLMQVLMVAMAMYGLSILIAHLIREKGA
jgi:hypothetical protein